MDCRIELLHIGDKLGLIRVLLHQLFKFLSIHDELVVVQIPLVRLLGLLLDWLKCSLVSCFCGVGMGSWINA